MANYDPPHVPLVTVNKRSGETWETCERRALIEAHRAVQNAVRARGWPTDPDSGENLTYITKVYRATLASPPCVRVEIRWVT